MHIMTGAPQVPVFCGTFLSGYSATYRKEPTQFYYNSDLCNYISRHIISYEALTQLTD